MAFILGAGLVGWLADRSGADFMRLFGKGKPAETSEHTPISASPAASAPPQTTPPQSNPAISAPETAPHSVDESAQYARITAMEQRIDQLMLRSEAASGNADRAEALLIAFAARRSVERGAALGYLADQLKMRFTDAQPHAVQAILAESKDPATLDQLTSRLSAMASHLSSGASTDTGWQRLRREISSLLIIRRDTTASASPDARYELARLHLQSGQIDEAIAYVRSLPGAADATDWIADAARYAEALRALDLIETTAILDPHRLKSASGEHIDQASPINASSSL